MEAGKTPTSLHSYRTRHARIITMRLEAILH
jgi:hypothetical protein